MKALYYVAWLLVFVAALFCFACADTTTTGPKPGEVIETWVCDPPPAVLTIATAAASFVLPGTLAAEAVTRIQQGLCVTVTQINALIAYLSGEEGQKGLKAAKAPLDLAPLIQWRDYGKRK